MKGFLCFFVLMLGMEFVLADGDLKMRIEDLSRKIDRDPRNASLYFQRGILHRMHGDWMLSMADLDEAKRIHPEFDEVDVARGETLVMAREYKAACLSLDRFLLRHPDHITALVLRAQIHVSLGNHQMAADDFSHAIKVSPSPHTDHYFGRAQALMVLDLNRNAKEALRGLDEGIQKMGNLVVLQSLAIDCEVAVKNFNGALKRVDLLMAQSQRKDGWLARRGEILQKAGRVKESREAYRKALAAIESLPEYRRKTQSTQELEKQIRASLASLGSSPGKK